jgi:hypothetical protein
MLLMEAAHQRLVSGHDDFCPKRLMLGIHTKRAGVERPKAAGVHTLDRSQSDGGDPPGAPAPAESPATWTCALRADALDELLWRRPAPL